MDVKELANVNKLTPHGKHGGEIYSQTDNLPLKQIVDFSTNVNDLARPEMFKHTILNAINQIPKYPDSDSSLLRQSLAKYFGNGLTDGNFIVGAGSMELITIFCDIFLEQGDEVIIPQPTFSEYEWAARRNGANVINLYRQPTKDFRIEGEQIINTFTSKTKIVFLCNPNNPNGLLETTEDEEGVITAALENEILVLLDETFIDFTGEENSFVRYVRTFENLFICRTFTKFFGLTGLRVGYGIATPMIIDILRQGQNLWAVNCIAQDVAREVLNKTEFIEKSIAFYAAEREFLASRLKEFPGLAVFPSDANYLLVNTECLGLTAEELKERLILEGFLIRNCSNYPGLNEYYARIAVKTRDLNSKFLEALKKAIEQG